MPEDRKVDIKTVAGRWVKCNAPDHEGLYRVFEVNIERNTCLIQRPDEVKAHWVNCRHLEFPS